jgi:hypothetical protein
MPSVEGFGLVTAEVAAYHEAGHAVMMFLLACPIAYALVRERDDGHFDGEVSRGDWINRSSDYEIYRDQEPMICLAGAVTEHLKTGDWDAARFHASDDYRRAEEHLSMFSSGPHHLPSFLSEALTRVEETFARPENWEAVTQLAQLLQDGRRAEGQDVTTVIKTAIDQSSPAA